MIGSLDLRILAELRARYGRRYRCPNSGRLAGEPECVPWFTFGWLSRPGEPGRIRVWVSCATAELDDEFDLDLASNGALVERDLEPASSPPLPARA